MQAPPAAPLTVLRIAAGPEGEVRNGAYVLYEERTRFDPATDKQVVVSFLWQGQPGLHRMVAQWKSPDGASSSPPPIQYESKDRRFGAFWSLNLTPSSAAGTYSIEVTVDGEPGGRFSFDVAPGTAGGANAPRVKRPLSQAELFARAHTSFVLLERATADGQRLESAAAFAAGRGRLFTSVAAVDGADVITAVLPDGARQPVTAVLGANRMQDWVVLAGGPAAEVAQPVAAETSTQVGDRLVSLEGASAESRVLVDAAISGRATAPGMGTRLLITLGSGAAPPGEPVFNEFGELVGIVGGSLVPGASDLSDLMRFRAELKGVPVVPIALIRAPLDAPVSLADARARGDFLGGVQGGQHLMTGGFARGITTAGAIAPTDQRREFSVRDKGMVVFVTWSPQAKLKGALTMKLYDDGNRVMAESKPGKLSLRPGDMRVSSWPLPAFPRPGVFRADVSVEGVPIWRGFVRLTE